MRMNVTTNAGDGLQSIVEQVTCSRFRVTFRDLDAHQNVAVRTYSSLEAADDAAMRFVGKGWL